MVSNPLPISVLLAVALTSLGSHPNAQGLQFSSAGNWIIANNPFDVAVKDLDSDGSPDVCVVHLDGSSSTLSTFRGLPSGSLQQWETVSHCCGGVYFVVGRVTNDAIPDCVVASYNGTPVLRLMTGGPPGMFGPGAPLFGSYGAFSVSGADLNGDGFVDLACGVSGYSIRVFLSDGLGGYLVPSAMTSCPGPSYITMGDVDGDSDLDIAAACSGSNEILIAVNLGNGVFDNPRTYGRGLYPQRIFIADISGDGMPDLLLYDQAGTQVLEGLGSLQFAVGLQIPGFSLREIVDLDGDGRLDLVGQEQPGLGIQLRRSLGNGGFSAPVLVATTGGVHGVRAAVLAGDARPQLLVVGVNSGGYLQLLRNQTPDCNDNGIDDPAEIANGWVSDCNGNGIPDSCELDCNQDGQPDACEISGDPSLDLNLNGILDECEPAGVPYCFGDGTGAACPCDPGQAGPAGGGCFHSMADGGRLSAFGNASVTLDSVTLQASALLPAAIGLLFQGNLQQANGLGSALGDGLLCVSQSIVRLGIRAASAGVLTFGRGAPGDSPIATAGLVPGTGATRFYQVWYRDPAPFCTPSTFNLTNGVRIDWMP